ncbi:MAG: RloB domain-containing protein [Gammaproteobacteria bacterium]|nr:RloB domain-containing protein [Gammaproteobacteria bacterium]
MLVVCEDTKSGKTYLEEAVTYYRVTVEVEVVHTGNTDPVGIVRKAIKRKREFDIVYCAIDWDGRPALDTAKTIAASHTNVVIIDSYPCFEYWLLLHDRYARRPYVREGERSPAACLLHDLKQIEAFKNYSKGTSHGLFGELIAHLPTASNHAARALKEAEETQEPNPSTKCHILIKEFQSLAKVMPAEE